MYYDYINSVYKDKLREYIYKKKRNRRRKEGKLFQGGARKL